MSGQEWRHPRATTSFSAFSAPMHRPTAVWGWTCAAWWGPAGQLFSWTIVPLSICWKRQCIIGGPENLPAVMVLEVIETIAILVK